MEITGLCSQPAGVTLVGSPQIAAPVTRSPVIATASVLSLGNTATSVWWVRVVSIGFLLCILWVHSLMGVLVLLFHSLNTGVWATTWQAAEAVLVISEVPTTIGRIAVSGHQRAEGNILSGSRETICFSTAENSELTDPENRASQIDSVASGQIP